MSSSSIISRKSSCTETASSPADSSSDSVRSGGLNTNSSPSPSIGTENADNDSGSDGLSNNCFDFAAFLDEQSSIQISAAGDVSVSPGFGNAVQDNNSHRHDGESLSTLQSSQAPSIPSAAAHAVGVSADEAFIRAISDSSSHGDDSSQSIQQSSQAPSIPSAAAHAVGVSADDSFIRAISGSRHGDDTSQSIQQSSQALSIPSVAARAVGVSADDAFIRAFTEESYEDSSNESEAVQPLASPDMLPWDGEPGRGGANADAASLEVSAITTLRSTYTQPPPPVAVNKLRFSSLGLHGRKNEIEILRGCFHRYVTKVAERQSSVQENEGGELMAVSGSANSSEVVFISGESGTGKTALAESIKDVVTSCEGTYISGKFDLKLRGPYFGIISLFRELCGEMLELRRTNSDRYQDLCNSIMAEVGDEIVLLFNVVPVLEEAIEVAVMPDVIADQGNKEARERLKYAFLQFFRVITRYFTHLVIVIDDLQWTDAPSIELLDGIINAKDINIMFIGIYRSNEVDDAHYLSKTIRDLHVAKKRGDFEVTEVSIGNLDATICEEIVVHLLPVDPSAETCRLAEICHKRTAGNAFHLLSFLSMLLERNLLQFKSGRPNGQCKWTWNCDRIEIVTAASSNVAELILNKISKQPQQLKHLLQLISCLGASFEKDVVIRVFPQMRDDITCNPGEIDELLSLAIREAFLEKQGESRYRWVHDSIQAAAMQQVVEAEMDAYKFKLGKALIQSLEEKVAEGYLFEIVNLLNSAEECPESDRLTLLSLNLKAAKKAVEFSSFEGCVRYAERGISLLPQDKWRQERQVSLELFSLIVEAYFSLADIDKMKIYGDEVLQQPTLSELEKVRVYHCNIGFFGGHMNKAKEALDMSIDVLRKLGCKFPRNKLLQVRKALASLAITKLPTVTDIAKLPPMVDETKKACMEMMVNAATHCHHCNNPFALIMVATRMVRWTMKYGVDVYSAPAFPIFGFVKNLFGTFNEGAQFADRGMQVLDICAEGKRTESRTTYICWFLVYPKSKPIHSILNHLLRGYKVGMEVGDVESAMWNVSMYICASIVAGKPLKPLAVDCITYIEQMKRLKQDLILDQSLPFAQGVLNLLGDAEDPLKLSGSVMVEEDYLKMIESSESRMMSFLHLQIFKNMMCNIFGDFEQGARLALERGDEYEKKNGSPLAMVDYLHQGISLFAMARKTKEQRYTKAAKKVKKQVDLWLEKGNINVTHLISFLDAETAALEGKSDEAARLYVQAISSAASSGFLHNAALASERFADYLLKDLNENEIAGQYFQDSIKYYTDWGSDYKADMLRQDYSHLWKEEIPEDIRVSPDLANDAGNTIHDRSSRNGDDTPQSIQHSSSQGHSISSSAARAVGVSADCAFIRAITEEGYEDSGDESEAVLQPLGLRGDDEPGRGGANEDSASIDISAITTPYTKPRTRPISGVGIDNIGDTVEEGSGEESVTTEVEFTDDKTFEVPSSSANSSHSQGHHLEGEETDDAESAASDISLRFCRSWCAYRPLADLQKQLEDSISALVQLNQRSQKRNLQAYLLVVKRLRNLSNNDETNLGFEELLRAGGATVNVFHTVKTMQMELFVLFRNWEGALLCLTEAPDMRNTFLGMPASERITFLEALVYLKTSTSATSWLARRKWKRKALKLMTVLKVSLEEGNSHVRHYIHILMAECYVMEGSARAAESNFKAAIALAELGGFLHDKALAHDLASASYKAQGKDFWANFHFECSQKIYTEWGATSKVVTEYIYYN